MDERTRFEKWAIKEGYLISKWESKYYTANDTNFAWEVWQAAIESKAEVQPISLCETCYRTCKKPSISGCVSFIESKAEVVKSCKGCVHKFYNACGLDGGIECIEWDHWESKEPNHD